MKQEKIFTLIELLVTVAQQNCLLKSKSNTSLRPAGRTSRLTQSSSSHLHIFTQSAFRLIELLVSKTCQICVYTLRKIASCLNICHCNPAIHQKFLARMDGPGEGRVFVSFVRIQRFEICILFIPGFLLNT